MRVIYVTNIPAPYRIDTLNRVGQELGVNFLVIFCARKEPNRNWNYPDIQFQHIFLKENWRPKKDKSTFVHNNPDVWKQLKAFNPDVVITGGFNPTMLYAFAYCLINNKKHIPISDAWAKSEDHLSFAHRMLRKMVYRFSHAFIACSEKGKQYYQQFSIKKERIFISHYTINSSIFQNNNHLHDRKYDLLFSAQFIERKNPGFFVATARELRTRIPDLKVLLLGDGPLKESMFRQMQEAGISYEYPGYAPQEALPGYYSQSRVFLFPTEYDAWGVVAQEALAAGTPTITTPDAGCSDELVLHNQNGFILPLDIAIWIEKCADLLLHEEKWGLFSTSAKQTAALFSHTRAADELLAACQYALNQEVKNDQ